MTQKPVVVYIHALSDVVGVAGLQHSYMSVLNPVGSGVVASALFFEVLSYSVGVVSVASSLKVFRITAHSGGTLISASDVNRFNTQHPDPKCTIRVDNPSTTVVGTVLRSISPPITTGVGGHVPFAGIPPSGTSFLFFPGEGFVIRTDNGDADVRWNVAYTWAEFS